jgi:hypothetical protein
MGIMEMTTTLSGSVILVGSFINRKPNISDHYFDILDKQTSVTARVFYNIEEHPEIYAHVHVGGDVLLSVVIDENAELDDGAEHVKNNIISVDMKEVW